ncbi:MAG: pentapeptide repeat-containing protein [Chlorobium sp.]|nr:MAG: pentapeptide repeat-containing protein [Chlorobium sp.]
MNTQITENKVFEKISFRETLLEKGVYEECLFINCNCNTSDLSGITFRTCTFNNCDCSLMSINKTSLQDVKFINCKLLGVQFNLCNGFLLGLDFENCILKLSAFHKLKLKNTRFNRCNLEEADFSEADLTGAVFEECNLLKATFMHTNLEKADFRSSCNYSIHPEINRIRHARFSIPGVVGLLSQYDIDIEW